MATPREPDAEMNLSVEGPGAVDTGQSALLKILLLPTYCNSGDRKQPAFPPGTEQDLLLADHPPQLCTL